MIFLPVASPWCVLALLLCAGCFVGNGARMHTCVRSVRSHNAVMLSATSAELQSKRGQYLQVGHRRMCNYVPCGGHRAATVRNGPPKKYGAALVKWSSGSLSASSPSTSVAASTACGDGSGSLKERKSLNNSSGPTCYWERTCCPPTRSEKHPSNAKSRLSIRCSLKEWAPRAAAQ